MGNPRCSKVIRANSSPSKSISVSCYIECFSKLYLFSCEGSYLLCPREHDNDCCGVC